MNTNRKPEQILIVDDTPQNIKLLGTMLRTGNYEVVVATSGKQALIALENTPIDLILLDIMMPDMDGFETCAEIKRMPQISDIPIIFLTASIDSGHVTKGFEMGAVDYVTKPFRAPELLARIRTHLDLRHSQQSLQKALDDQARVRREHESFVRHELNNMLQPILSYSEAILFMDETEEERQESAQIIFDSTKRVSDLLQALKNIQSLESRSIPLTKCEVSLSSLLKQTISDLSPSCNGHAPDIHFKNSVTNDTIKVDRNLMNGVFHNLIKNAVEHVTHLPDKNQKTVSVILHEEDNHLVVQVQNWGPLVPSKQIKHFFEKFNTDREYKKNGTGLGTTYAYWVTKAHDGKIAVSSDEKEGTIVTVKLPCF